MAKHHPLPKLSALVGKNAGNHPALNSGALPALSDLVGKGGNHPKYKEAAPKKHGGFFHDLKKYSGSGLAGNLAKDVGHTAVGIGPGLYKAGEAAYENVRHPLRGQNLGDVKHPLSKKNFEYHPSGKNASPFEKAVVAPAAADYKRRYGPLLHGHVGAFASEAYRHPLAPALDLLTVATLGAGGAAKAGEIAAEAGMISDTSRLAKLGQRAELTTRSPRALATGKGPRNIDITSTRPLVKGRQQLAAKVTGKEGLKVGPVQVGGEVRRYGKQIQAQAIQHALGRLADYQPYLKATRHLSQREWAALHIRAIDIHPSELQTLWKGTPAEKWVQDARVTRLVESPTKKLQAAETAARQLSLAGEKLLKEKRLLNDETATARPGLTKTQAAERLGRQARSIHGKPYYLPHVMEDKFTPNPLIPGGGGKGIPRTPGATKQNLGVLALSGKLHLRGDVLGPEFLRRVKYVKYDEIHNALVRGAIRVTHQELEQHYGGQLPKGYEYMRTKPSTTIPHTMRGQADKANPIEKLIPNAEDLHDSQLAKDGFSTTDPAQAHTSGGKYYIVPTKTVKAATGEFTRSSNFTRTFVKQPLAVWRAAVLGLRVGFFTNNFVGNSVMYAAKTGGQGALRDLFMAIKESHGDTIARKALDNPATPPALRASLYKEFFPEQLGNTFGKTQSPTASRLGTAASTAGRAWQQTTSALPRLTSAVAETAPRQALIRHYIRHSPEFKSVYRGMPKQTRAFEAAARQVLEGKGSAAYQRMISKQVNQALGDYLNLSSVERNVLRNAIPFYSWYRAITTTTAHLAVDTPLRAVILGQIGQIGKQWSDQKLGDVPSFLEGAIPLGQGRQGTQRVLASQGLNPYATLDQLRRGAGGDVSSLGLNPFVQGTLDTYARATSRGKKVGPGALAATTLQQMLLGLPPARVIAPGKPSKLYPTRDRRTQELGYLGLSVKEYNRAEAARQKKLGR